MNKALFFEKLYRIVNKYNAKTKKPRQYGRDPVILYSSEVHMIEMIGAAAESTTTQIADAMAITKGAVSQTTAKLLRKGLIEKIPVVDSPNTALISLTERGQEVFEEHRKLHEQMIVEIDAILGTASEETSQKLNEILNVIDNALNR